MAFDESVRGKGNASERAKLRIGVIGAGVSGLSAAWLLSNKHDVRLFEQEGRLGGHANTIDVPNEPQSKAPPSAEARSASSNPVLSVDAGFIVFNKPNYPNFTALMSHLGIEIDDTCMSFGVSLNGGRTEYSGQSLSALFANPAAALSPSHWTMLRDILRFNAAARKALSDGIDRTETVASFVRRHRLSQSFVDHFLKPFAAAIWSAPSERVLDYAACAFLKFFSNHGLLQVLNMPLWNTVHGGSRTYVNAIESALGSSVRVSRKIVSVERSGAGVEVIDATGAREVFDHVVIASHADEALALIEAPTDDERSLLGAFRYQGNRAIMHSDPAAMPTRKVAWSSWNYLGSEDGVAVSYWMNRLQDLGEGARDVFVSLNPTIPIKPELVHETFDYAHPMFDVGAEKAQRRLWSLQGTDRIWFCGSYFGQGFHEDGLQSGLAVAEALGGGRRPWNVENESGRIHLPEGRSRVSPAQVD
ncbi:MAG: FAD-dependent oxidoreductase [Pseudomonadota bacterium]